MLTQPASLAASSAPESAVSLALLSAFASSILSGLSVMIECTRIGQPAFVPPRQLQYPMSSRAKRLLNSRD